MQTDKITKWEALTVSVQDGSRAIHDVINEYGEEGWEFCQWLPGKDGSIYIFKRPKQ